MAIYTLSMTILRVAFNGREYVSFTDNCTNGIFKTVYIIVVQVGMSLLTWELIICEISTLFIKCEWTVSHRVTHNV